MSRSHETLLKKYLQLPDRLEAAIAGLSEAELDLNQGAGWSIRQYVHHTVEGESLWQLCLRAVVGMDGIALPIQWYFSLSQDEWVDRWAYDRRSLDPSLALFRASTRNLVEFLRNLPDAWEHFGRVTWPGAGEETHLTVRDIVLMHIGHMDHHIADIQAIRQLHQC